MEPTVYEYLLSSVEEQFGVTPTVDTESDVFVSAPITVQLTRSGWHATAPLPEDPSKDEVDQLVEHFCEAWANDRGE